MEKWFCWGAMGVSGLLLVLFLLDLFLGIPFMGLNVYVDSIVLVCCLILFYLGWNAYRDIR